MELAHLPSSGGTDASLPEATSLAGRRALAPRIGGGRANALIGYPGLHPTSPRTPGRGPAKPFHGPLRETRSGHTPVTFDTIAVLCRLYTWSWTGIRLSVRSKFMAPSRNSVLRSKYTCTIRLNTDAYLCAVIARRNLRRSTARPMASDASRASQGCIPRRSCIVGHVSSPGSHAFAHGTPHTEHGAHAPMNTPNEHPHGCHTSAHPIPSSLARCCPPTPDHTHFFLGGVSGRLPNPNLAFSAGLRMRKEHMRLSSMVITAPALSNSPQ